MTTSATPHADKSLFMAATKGEARRKARRDRELSNPRANESGTDALAARAFGTLLEQVSYADMPMVLGWWPDARLVYVHTYRLERDREEQPRVPIRDAGSR